VLTTKSVPPGSDVHRGVAHHHGALRRDAELLQDPEQALGIGLAGRPVVAAHHALEASKDPQARQQPAAQGPRFVGEHRQPRRGQLVEGGPGSRVEARGLEQALPVALEEEREHVLGGGGDPGR
jgi:hypothetical protein